MRIAVAGLEGLVVDFVDRKARSRRTSASRSMLSRAATLKDALSWVRGRARNHEQGATAPLRRRDAAPGKLLFLFCGKSHAWRDRGRILYRDEPIFRAAIDGADSIVREIVGFSPSAAFGGEWLPDCWDVEVRSEIVTMALAQIGLVDLWRASGGAEAGFMGLSGGEISALYGAGILSREEAVQTICWIAMCLRHPDGRCSSFLVTASAAKAERLARAAPALLEFGGEVVPGLSHLHASHAESAENRAFLEARVGIVAEHDSSYRYHVREMGLDEDLFAEKVPFVRARHDHPPLYLCSFGGRVPEGYAFDWRHWSWMVSSPYRMSLASTAACSDGFDEVVVVGSKAIGEWHLETARRLGRRAEAIRPLERGSSDWPCGAGSAGFVDRARIPASASAGTRRADAQEDLAAPAALADPFAAYERLRAQGAVRYLPAQRFWLVLGHAEMKSVLAQPALFGNAPYGLVDPFLIGADPPQHAEVRRAVSAHFDRRTLGRIEAASSDRARALLTAGFDVVADYAAPLANAAAADLIGLDAATVAAIAAAGEAAADAPKPFEALIGEVRDLAHHAALYRRLATVGGTSFDEQSRRSLIGFLWVAAVTTTERAIASAAIRLIESEDRLALLRQRPELLTQFVEEVLRLHPPDHMIPRETRSAAMLGGISIPAGARVELCTSAANRDPNVFECPAEFRLDRRPGHLSFGSGIHHCTGTALARRILSVAARTLIDAPGLRMIQPPETVEYFSNVHARYPRSFVIGS